MTVRQRILIVLLTTILCVSGLPVSASQPSASGTRLMLSHQARFTAQIPADWQIDASGSMEYISPDGEGFIAITTYPTSLPSLTRACQSAARLFDSGDVAHGVVTWVTFRSRIACRLDSSASTGADSEPVALIFLHPNPLRSSIDDGAYFTYAGVMIDRAHFAEVTASMSFDLDDITPELYLDSAIDILERHAYLRDEIDWDSVRADAEASISGDDTEPGIDIALDALKDAGDRHSYLWDATQLDTFTDTSSDDIPVTQLPTSLAFSDRINYINLPPIQGDASVYRLYATTGNQVIADVDTTSTCGWIIDLRSNFGGNSDPMIAAVGEILGDGPFAGFSYSDGTTSLEAYKDGSVYDASSSPTDSLIEGPIYTVRQPDAAVAILIGSVTGSAAEYTGIAFLGRPNTRSFGEPSADLTTGITGYILVDGAAFGLATNAMIDRNGTTYPDGIEPDTAVDFETAGIMDPSDPVATAATDWLLQQPSCT